MNQERIIIGCDQLGGSDWGTTKLTEVTFGNEKRYKNSLKSIPLRRWGSPEDMGEVCCFLSSEEASYVTGQMLTVDGGMSLS